MVFPEGIFINLNFWSVPQEWDGHLAGAEGGVDPATLSALSVEASEWRTTQDGQRILTTTPTVLGGCRAQVYRAAGATQWYTAVIVGVNEHTGVSIAFITAILCIYYKCVENSRFAMKERKNYAKMVKDVSICGQVRLMCIVCCRFSFRS